jgi:DNA-binding LacI/PurR family transcriptional regulator
LSSIYEVAEQAGVSITTVSHVFSGHRPVAPETRDRVLEVADKLNYRPRLTAQGLATGRAMILGIHFPYEGDSLIRNPYFPELLEGLSEAAARAGYGFLLIPRSLEQPDFSQEDLLNRMDGAIIADPMMDDLYLRPILDHDFPTITIGRHLGRRQFPWVDADHQHGIHQLFRHFDERGYRNPALISTTLNMSYVEDIEQAFAQEAEVRGMPVRIAQPNDLSEHEAYAVAIELLGEAERPDAIVAATDHQAMSVLRAARELGINVPTELGVVGEGDTVLASNAVPSLTSISVQPRRLGQAAVELLLGLLDGTETAEEQLIPAELIARDSTLR